jgi:serine/threonine-protein kinase
MLAGRYRIVGLLGRGGMGEVYRADDLKLGQPVAIKLLPMQFAADPARLARFHAEVRNAREVAHPHVCRVYDIGDVDGQLFLSMEYVDGEDLASLLRRIGRLPPAKAVEIARQLCSGLAAAHDRGVIHRDLKPHNVMLDGQGRVRITDFGLAVRENEDSGATAGTPAYMSPEQLAGQPATVRSDVYSLGLVLYELFTGKRTFEASTFAEWQRKHGEEKPTSPSLHTGDLDPAVERVILRCLEKDPAKRPASATQVALALPGGDPLAAAIAAGETPSPEMVAAAGGEGALPRTVAWTLLAGALATIGAVLLLAPYSTDQGLAPMENAPSVLRARARELASRFGYEKNPVDSADWLVRDYDPIRFLAQSVPSNEWRRRIGEIGPPVLYRYRQSPRPLISKGGEVVTGEDPPSDLSGMVQVATDAAGRLRYFEAVPPQVETAAAVAPPAFDWATLFTEAQLDPSRFQPATPEWLPPVPFDARAQWNGTLSQFPDLPLRVTAAAYGGKLVYFEILGPWSVPNRMTPRKVAAGVRAGEITLSLMILTLMIAGAVFARRNLRRGRGDRRGALRMAAAAGILYFAAWAAGTHHAGWIQDWLSDLLFPALARALFLAAMCWVMYVAIEPYVRRRVPELLIGWTRVLEGKIRDARVGRDTLIGMLVGASIAFLVHLANGLPTWFPFPGQTTVPPSAMFGRHSTNALPLLLEGVLQGLLRGLSMFSVYFLLRALFRRTLPAAIGVGIVSFLLGAAGENPWLEVPEYLLIAVLVAVCTARFGLLPIVVASSAWVGLVQLPVSVDPTQWYAAIFIPCLVVLVGVTLFAFRTSLGSQPLFGGSLED